MSPKNTDDRAENKRAEFQVAELVPQQTIETILSARHKDPLAAMSMAQYMIEGRWPKPYSARDVYAILVDAERLGSDSSAMTLSHLFATGKAGFPVDNESSAYWLNQAYLDGNKSAALSIGKNFITKGNCVDGLNPLARAAESADKYIKIESLKALSNCQINLPIKLAQSLPSGLKESNPDLWAKIIVLAQDDRNPLSFSDACNAAKALSAHPLQSNPYMMLLLAQTLFDGAAGGAKDAAAAMLLKLDQGKSRPDAIDRFSSLDIEQQVELSNEPVNSLLSRASTQ